MQVSERKVLFVVVIILLFMNSITPLALQLSQHVRSGVLRMVEAGPANAGGQRCVTAVPNVLVSAYCLT